MTAYPDCMWREKTQQIRFVLGEWCIASMRLPALELTVPPSRLGRDPDEVELPESIFTSETRLAIVASHPCENGPARVKTLPHSVRYAPSIHNHYLVSLKGTFDEFFRRLSKKNRHEIRRKLRNFERRSGRPIQVNEYRGRDRLEEFLALATPLAKKTYQHRLLKVALPDSEEFREEALELAEADQARGYLLYDEDRPIAFGYCQSRDDVVYYRYTGYDPDFRDRSPGIVVLHEMLRLLIAEKRHEFLDLGHGEGQYKRDFATEALQCATLYYFPRSWKSRAIIAMHRFCDGCSNSAAAALDKLGLKARIKRLLRR